MSFIETDIDPANIDNLITKAETALVAENPGSDEHLKVLTSLERLYKLRLSLIPDPTPVVIEEVPVDKDRMRLKDWAMLLVPLIGTGMILVTEAYGHTLTSKSWQERKALK